MVQQRYTQQLAAPAQAPRELDIVCGRGGIPAGMVVRQNDRCTVLKDALTEYLARLSGGIPRELIGLARYACLDARLKERHVIDEEAVECAAQRKRRDYQVLLDSAQLGRLAEIHVNQRVENDEQDRALLHNLSVLEYRNRDVWHDVHPLIEPLLPRDEEA